MRPPCATVGLILLNAPLLGSLQLPAAPAAEVSPGIRHRPETLPILSPSVSCWHKCQAPPVSHSSILSSCPSPHISLSRSPFQVPEMPFHHAPVFIMRTPPHPLHHHHFAPIALSFSFLFHLCSIFLPLSQAILRESFPLFSPFRNHTIGLAASVCFFLFFFPYALSKTMAIRCKAGG